MKTLKLRRITMAMNKFKTKLESLDTTDDHVIIKINRQEWGFFSVDKSLTLQSFQCHRGDMPLNPLHVKYIQITHVPAALSLILAVPLMTGSSPQSLLITAHSIREA